MDKTVKEFLDYLFYIGIVTNDSFQNFLNYLNSNINSSKKLSELLMNSFYIYLKSLSEKKQKKISSNIVKNFFQNKRKANIKIIQNLINIYEKNKPQKLKNSFFYWLKRTKNNEKISENDFEESILKNYFSEKTIQNKRYIRNFYNRSNNLLNTNNFQSKTIRSHNSSRSVLNDFINRQDEFNKNKLKKKEMLIQQNEDEYDLLCTFSPKIRKKSFDKNANNSKTTFNKNNNIYQKLYNDYHKRKNDHNRKVCDYFKRIKSESSLSSNHSPSKKFIDRGKIEKLYNDYKQREIKRMQLINKINLENGITFKPDIYRKIFSKKKE